MCRRCFACAGPTRLRSVKYGCYHGARLLRSGRGELASFTDKRRILGNAFRGDVERPDFSDLVKDFAKDVNDLQFQAGHAIDMLATGQAADVHQVMVAVEEAGIARDMMLEIRNRVLEGYQELIRMQV